MTNQYTLAAILQGTYRLSKSGVKNIYSICVCLCSYNSKLTFYTSLYPAQVYIIEEGRCLTQLYMLLLYIMYSHVVYKFNFVYRIQSHVPDCVLPQACIENAFSTTFHQSQQLHSIIYLSYDCASAGYGIVCDHFAQVHCTITSPNGLH